MVLIIMFQVSAQELTLIRVAVFQPSFIIFLFPVMVIENDRPPNPLPLTVGASSVSRVHKNHDLGNVTMNTKQARKMGYKISPRMYSWNSETFLWMCHKDIKQSSYSCFCVPFQSWEPKRYFHSGSSVTAYGISSISNHLFQHMQSPWCGQWEQRSWGRSVNTSSRRWRKWHRSNGYN